jgi:GWxTD domain-containing protein
LSLENHAAEDDVYWAMRDPLFLTPENERLAEHFSRVAYADMAFSDPWSGTIGRNSDLGRVWIWYGRSGPAYRRFDPRLVFVRANRMYNYARLSEQSEFLLNQLRKEVPERYQPTHPRIVASLLFQVARFHGTERKTELVVYGGRIPDDALGKTDSIRTGLFVFALNPWNAAASERSTVSSNTPVRPHFAAQLDPGRYMVSLEALGNDRAATGRDTIVIAPRGAGLELSDLLLADRIMPRAATPRSRDDLAIEGSATLTFRARSPVGVVWELYGLATDSVNIARYHVQLEVRDTRGGLIRALRTLTLQGNARETNLAWDAERALEPNEAALEFTTLALIDPRPGSYRLLISVTDRITGAHASAERQFTVVP